MTEHRKKATSLVALVLLALVCTDCFPRRGRGFYGRRGGYYRAPYRAGVGSWLAAAVVGAAIVGTAAAVAAADQARYNPNVCRARQYYNGRWHYYCQDRWAYYEGNQWYSYPPSAPPQGAPPPGQPPPGDQGQPPPGMEGQPPPGGDDQGQPPPGAPPPNLPPPSAPPPMM